MRVLIVEDEDQLREQLKVSLVDAGFSVDSAVDGEEALYYGREFDYDVAVLDLGLPKLSGIEVIKELRTQERNFPILILTARGNWTDKVEGLDAGADDYLVKPFHIEELKARLNALLRRSVGQAKPVLTSGPLRLDTIKQEVTVHDVYVELTAYEYKVLEYLMMHPGEVISKMVLTEHIYAQDFERESNVIEVFVGRLRKKLDPNNEFKPIETLRGRGYRFNLGA